MTIRQCPESDEVGGATYLAANATVVSKVPFRAAGETRPADKADHQLASVTAWEVGRHGLQTRVGHIARRQKLQLVNPLRSNTPTDVGTMHLSASVK